MQELDIEALKIDNHHKKRFNIDPGKDFHDRISILISNFKELEMKLKSTCTHEHKDHSYGIHTTHGFNGIGVLVTCNTCDSVIHWNDDPQCNTKEEIEANEKNYKRLKDEYKMLR